MKLSYGLLFAGIPMYSSAYNPFKATSESHTAINGENHFSSSLNPLTSLQMVLK